MVMLTSGRTADQDEAVKTQLRKMIRVSKPKRLPPTGSSDTPLMLRLTYTLKAITDLVGIRFVCLSFCVPPQEG